MRTAAALLTAFLLSSGFLFSQGRIYLVLGSDTAIWDGMDVARYNCTYALSLFTDPTRNASRVMDPAFRLSLRDSYGTPVKLTWWMMAGNIFRFATNTNIPNPNTMTLHLMKKYQGGSVVAWGDELSLHYHTFAWTDYDGDGTYYWNQAHAFAETSGDFDVTLAEMLLEEETFPVSFRSGWHAMDNGWQQRLDTLLLYCMHNDWPGRHTDLTEPLDNIFDWSRAPSAFVPFHPSPTDYQVPGAGRSWNVRSAYMASVDSTFMHDLFVAAAAGTDQVACLWAHLPETDFPDNVRRVDAAAHTVAPLFPGVQFRYCTAVEAMQRWRGIADTLKPQLVLTEISGGPMLRWSVTSNEPLFQTTPFVAVKNRYGEYSVLPCHPTGNLTWETTQGLERADLSKVGVAATDTAGNLTTALIRYLPDDIFVDDADPGYLELSGSWATSPNASWGTTSRLSTPGSTDSSIVGWTPQIAVAGTYDIFTQVPEVGNAARQVEFRILEGGEVVATKMFQSGVPSRRWVYLGTRALSPAVVNSVRMVVHGSTQPGTQVAADVVRFSALVRNQWLVVEPIDAGDVIVQQENIRSIPVRNEGIEPVVLSAISSVRGIVTVGTPLPLTVPAMGEGELEVNVESSTVGVLTDTLVIVSDDPHHAIERVAVRGNVVNYFVVVDDRDSLSYSETGTWNFSVASAFGATSRYAYPSGGPSAAFATHLTRSGVYQIQEIVPTTVNASVRARYVLRLDGVRVDSAFIDQNAGSGGWVVVLEHAAQAGTEARLELTDAMSPVVQGAVLRADAIRFQWIGESTDITRQDGAIPVSFSLAQNSPNPFNPTTTIRFSLPRAVDVSIAVYNVLGQHVTTLVNAWMQPGVHAVHFDGSGLASGMYYYRLTAGNFVGTRKMLLVR